MMPTTNPKIEALKEVLRLFVFGLVAVLVVNLDQLIPLFPEIPSRWWFVIALFLRYVDKFIHENGKLTGDQNWLTGVRGLSGF